MFFDNKKFEDYYVTYFDVENRLVHCKFFKKFPEAREFYYKTIREARDGVIHANVVTLGKRFTYGFDHMFEQF